ncbi:MAG: hypothetical protein ACI9MR_002436 [Myxococcota bacterium]|jgi:hypothetical protein
MTDEGRRGVIFALLLLTVVAAVVIAFIVATRTDTPMVLPERPATIEKTLKEVPDVSTGLGTSGATSKPVQ